MKEIFTHINDMDEKCFSCLSSVLLNPGLSFQCSAASRIHHSDLFRNDFMIPQKIAESFVGIYLEKEDSCYYVNDESIRKVLCQVHLKRNPEVFLEMCPLRYLSYIMDHDDVCITKDAFYGTLLLRFFNEIKMHPSHSLFEELARLLEMKNVDEHIFSFDAVKANIAQIPNTIKAHLANQLAVSGKDEFTSLIQMLVKDFNLTAKNVSKMSYDDISILSDENIAHSRSTFTAIACEFDQTRYEWGRKTENIYPYCLSNQVLERLVKSVYMTDTLMAKILIRAVEENFCSQFSVRSVYVWTGYRFQKQRVTCNEYVIIVCKEGFKCTAKEVLPLKYCGLEVLVKEISEVDGESLAIMEYEAKFNLDRNLVIHDWVINSLLQSHSNITGITTSSVLSRNYKPGKPPNIEPVSCIVISCHTKGIIPMGEKPFPTNLNGYPVDVRESGAAISATRHPQIGDSIKSSTAEMGKGTLGGFVFVGNKIYYLTAAHVLVLKIHLNENLFENAKTLDVKILREISDEWNECGILDRGYFGEIRLKRKFTVDAVLVNINSEDHKPKHPFVPQKNMIDAGFLEGSKPIFSGKIKDVSNLDEPLNIVKYGQTTLWTKGRLTRINTMKTIKINENGSFFKQYFGQMVIKSDHGKFADLGDSGSLVFIVSDYNDPELECIGLLNAVDQASGEVYVTPIRAVLESLRLDENAFKKIDPPFTLTYLNMIRERLDLHTEILLNIEENIRQQAS
ncbi:uncharacterized protein LOC134259798 isoform X1 [Saccostrea cucullata]|uniref:uncharacterized protein LOC134259798 isoform X1 n=1 Tax=Saccostrea cuccullata TaxID=36930 RepID=UPI002ED02200